MKHIIRVLSFFLLTTMLACQTIKTNQMKDKQTEEIFSSLLKETTLSIKPDESINKKAFVEQNLKNAKAWMAAFKFLKENDLANMPVGKYDLFPDGTYATVSDYETKDPESTYFEAHRKYIDIQYVVKGEEYIYLKKIDATKKEYKPYVEKQDIEFFSITGHQKLHAKPDVFFVFFPVDGHKPCLKVNNTSPVRKIVVKIPYINY